MLTEKAQAVTKALDLTVPENQQVVEYIALLETQIKGVIIDHEDEVMAHRLVYTNGDELRETLGLPHWNRTKQKMLSL